MYHESFYTDSSGAPENPRIVDVSCDTANIEWDAPKDDGGSEIIGYIIQKKEIGRRAFHDVFQVNLNVCNRGSNFFMIIFVIAFILIFER